MTQKEYFQKWYQANKHRYPEYYRRRKEKDPEGLRKQKTAYMRQWRAENPGRRSPRSEATRLKDRERRIKWRKENPELHSAQVCAWQKKNIRKVLDRHKVWSKAKRKTDPNWKLKCYLRTRLYNALKGISKSAPTMKLLGCSIEYLWLHLESQFQDGMTRENYGTIWEVDHVVPCALFDLTKTDHQKRCFFFGNLQPLFVEANRSKGAKHKEKVL